MQMALLEFDIVEIIFRYFPRRWIDFGSTLLFTPGHENMDISDIELAFKERFRVVGSLPAVRD